MAPSRPCKPSRPVASTTFTFTDQPPAAGRYLYRVRLDNVAGQQFYSGTEEAFLLQAGLPRPTPTRCGPASPYQLVANTAAAVAIELYDMLGRFQRAAIVRA